MTEFQNKSNSSEIVNDGLALKIFKDSCCSQCTCENESSKIVETDAMGREKFWEESQ